MLVIASFAIWACGKDDDSPQEETNRQEQSSDTTGNQTDVTDNKQPANGDNPQTSDGEGNNQNTGNENNTNGDGNGTQNSETETPGSGGNDSNAEVQEDEPLNPFVGYWKSENQNMSDYIFFEDGTSAILKNNEITDHGKWVYDEGTRYFSNTNPSWTALITLHDEEDMIGVVISNNKTLSFKKAKPYNEFEIIRGKKFKKVGCDTTITIYISYGLNRVSFSPSKTFPPFDVSKKQSNYTKVWNSKRKDIHTFEYTPAEIRCKADGTYTVAYYEYHTIDKCTDVYKQVGKQNVFLKTEHDKSTQTRTFPIGSGKYTLEEIYSPKKTKITFTGILSGTFAATTE